MLQIVKKPPVSSLKSGLISIAAIVLALACSGVIMALLGYNPFTVMVNIVNGALGSFYRFEETVNKAVPLLILSLGVAVAFKMKFWNIGAEGQFYMGAFGATWVAVYLMPDMPSYITLPVMAIIAILFGAVWGLIPAVLKIRFGTSETLTTLMMNYIAIGWVTYLQYVLWRDPAAVGFPRVAKFKSGATMPDVLGLHAGWVIALLLVVLIYVLMKYSELGYEITVLGDNKDTARYAGMNVTKTIMLAMILSAGLCGLTGMIQASAIEKTLNYQMSSGLGFTAIIVAYLGKLSAPVILVASFLFAMLIQGGNYLQSAMQIPSSVSSIIQGIILFFVLGSEFFLQYRIVRHKRGEAKQA